MEWAQTSAKHIALQASMPGGLYKTRGEYDRQWRTALAGDRYRQLRQRIGAPALVIHCMRLLQCRIRLHRRRRVKRE